MKKPLALSSLLLILTGFGVTSPTLTLKAETPAVISQISQAAPNNSNPAQSGVELLNPGIEPRQQLRFTPAANTRQTTIMTMNMNMAATIDDQVMPAIDFPPVKMTLEAGVKQIDPNGDTHIELSYSQVELSSNTALPASVLDSIRSQLDKITGMKMSYILTSQGKAKDVNVVFPDDIDPNIKQFLQPMLNSLEQLSNSPFPQANVGVGAKWRVLSSVPPVGLPINQIDILYEIVNLQNNTVTLKISTDTKGEPKAVSGVNFPGLPPGMEVNIKSMAIQSNGTLTGSLDQIMPNIGNMSVISNMEFAIKYPKSKEEAMVNMKSSVNITMESQ